MIEIIIVLFILLVLSAIPIGTSVYKSSEGRNLDRVKRVNLWYGTTDEGLCYIDIRKFIVYSTIEKIPKEWRSANSFKAVAAVVMKDGDIQYVSFTARLCEDDTVYYITSEEYYRICRYGRILGMVMPLPDYNRYLKEVLNKDKYDLAEKSKYKLFGYNVSVKDNFTPKYRQTVLMFMLESGLTSKYEALRFLDFNISNHAHNPNDKLAISKWEADRFFISNYTFGSVDVNWVTTSNPPNVETVRTPIRDNISHSKGDGQSVRRTTVSTELKPIPENNNSKLNSGNAKKNVEDPRRFSNFSTGQPVTHKTFGAGVVTDIDLANNWIYIQFNVEDQPKRFKLDIIERFID